MIGGVDVIGEFTMIGCCVIDDFLPFLPPMKVAGDNESLIEATDSQCQLAYLLYGEAVTP